MAKMSEREKARRKKIWDRVKTTRAKWREDWLRRSPIVSMATYLNRDETLRREGFLGWERFWLCQHRLDSPGMRAMRAERLEYLNAFGVTFENWNEYRSEIARVYWEHNWTFRDGSLNPFAMLEYVKWRGHYPDTPQPVRKRPRVSPTKAQREAARHPPKIPGAAEFIARERLR